jgi:prevent-host-death family protein
MKRKRSTMRVVASTELKNQAGAVMRRVEQGEMQIVTRSGMPIGAIIPMADVERFYPDQLAMDVKRKRAWQQLMEVLSETQKGGDKFSEDEVEDDVQKAVDEARHGRRKK